MSNKHYIMPKPEDFSPWYWQIAQGLLDGKSSQDIRKCYKWDIEEKSAPKRVHSFKKAIKFPRLSKQQALREGSFPSVQQAVNDAPELLRAIAKDGKKLGWFAAVPQSQARALKLMLFHNFQMEAVTQELNYSAGSLNAFLSHAVHTAQVSSRDELFRKLKKLKPVLLRIENYNNPAENAHHRADT